MKTFESYFRESKSYSDTFKDIYIHVGALNSKKKEFLTLMKGATDFDDLEITFDTDFKCTISQDGDEIDNEKFNVTKVKQITGIFTVDGKDERIDVKKDDMIAKKLVNNILNDMYHGDIDELEKDHGVKLDSLKKEFDKIYK